MDNTADRKKGLTNVAVSIAFKLLLLIANILVRRYLIRYVGNAVNGLNSLYLSILDFLTVAELGIGSAITFCMYRPIATGDTNTVSALYRLFTRLYLIIGGIIAVGGCGIMPFLPYLAKDYTAVNVNLYLTFGLMVASVVLTYMFSAQTSLINAYKNNYITTMISSVGLLVQYAVQIAVLATTGSFVWFIVCRIGAGLLQWLVTNIIANRKYGTIMHNRQSLSPTAKREVVKNIKALFMHRIGGVLVNTSSNLIISAFIGIVILGKYSNYTTIIISMTSVIALFFTPLTSIIGHRYATADKQTTTKYFRFFHTFNYLLGMLFFLGYYAIIDDLVTLLFGPGLEMEKDITFIITLNYFIQFMRQATLLFRDATGTFYNDRWKPLAEGCINVALALLFVREWGIIGVSMATILTNIFICHIVEPYVLHRYALGISTKPFYLQNYSYMAVFTLALVSLHFCMVETGRVWLELLINGCIAVAIAVVPCVLTVLIQRSFRTQLKQLLFRGKHSSDGNKD